MMPGMKTAGQAATKNAWPNGGEHLDRDSADAAHSETFCADHLLPEPPPDQLNTDSAANVRLLHSAGCSLSVTADVHEGFAG